MGETSGFVSPARVFARPTADQIWLGPPQRAALSQLSKPHSARALLGPPSSGKTTLLAHLSETPPRDSVLLHCRGPKQDATAVLSSLLLAADLGPWDLSEIEQRNLLTVFLQQRRSQGRRVLVVIDDAHKLAPAAWEEIARLTLLKIDGRSAIELLMAGPDSLADDISRTFGASPLAYQLPAPTHEDLLAYLDWRLTRFELREIITPIAAQMLARLSGNRYAALNVLSQMALLLAHQLRLDRIDARVVRQAVGTLAARHSSKLDPAAPAPPAPEAGAPPKGFLVISRSGKTAARVAIGQRTLIGRSEHNDVCLASPYLSRHHAVIVGTPDGYYVVDLNSANGVTLNGKRVERAVLCDQDVLAMGPFRLKLQIPDWLAQRDPMPREDSLSDTAVIPSHDQQNSTLWRVK